MAGDVMGSGISALAGTGRGRAVIAPSCFWIRVARLGWAYSAVLRLALPAFLLLAMVGCAQHGASLTLRSENGIFTQKFEKAYVGRADDGDLHFILIDEGVKAPRKQKGRAIQPVAETPLRQVVHLRLFWRALTHSGRDSVRPTNASAEWFVTGVGSLGHQDMLHYSGAGTVTHSKGPGDVKATLRDFTLRPLQARGNLTDPIGTAQLSGTLNAQRDDEFVRNMLTEFDDQPVDATP